MKLASYIRPFDAKQKIYVLDKGTETEEVRLTSLEGFADTVMQLMQEYNITDIELHGSEPFCVKAKDNILSAEMTKYNNNQVNIKIVTEGDV